ncbi:TPA: hypothetical protein ABHN85_19695 [Pseudomonas sp. H2]|uniref:hypothetical protein n=1 Tax=Pseudomonas sp. H2 TaxID=658612 RepID=UPI000512B97A|nr:hypothetical protein [Pseudomonas sp. H2]KGI92464.1 hypothetical protein MD26_14970 [Pseudomonas sp. H2]
MTDKKNPKDDDDDFDFSDPVLSKDFNSEDNPPTAMVAETNDFDFDDFDFVSLAPKPIWIRKIDCTNLNELDQQIVRTLLSFRDYTKSTQKFSNAIIQNEFANADQDGKTDFIVKKVCLHIVECKKMSMHVKHYYLSKLEEYLAEVFTQEAKQQFDKFVGEVKQEVKEGFDEMRKQIV